MPDGRNDETGTETGRGPERNIIEVFYPVSRLFDQDEPHRYERERDRDRRPPPSSEREPEKPRPVNRKPPPVQEEDIKPAVIPGPIVATTLLDEEDPPLSQLMGFSRFSSTKGKKHVDYGGVETHKQRKYRQYMNRPGGFNMPLDPSQLVP